MKTVLLVGSDRLTHVKSTLYKMLSFCFDCTLQLHRDRGYLCIIKLIMPAFLSKCLGISHTAGLQHCI